MKTAKVEVKTIYTVELEIAEIMKIYQDYTADDTLKSMHPMAFRHFKEGEQYTDAQFVKALWLAHADTYSVIAKSLGFKGWENAGYYNHNENTYTMVVYNHGDTLNK